MTVLELISIFGTAAGAGGVVYACRSMAGPMWSELTGRAVALIGPALDLGDAEGDAQADATETPAPSQSSAYLDPRLAQEGALPSEARAALLERLAERFRGLGVRFGIALDGPQSAGCLSIAAAYARRACADGTYRGAWLVDASSATATAGDMEVLARRLDITTDGPASEIIRTVKRGMLTGKGRWLLIHENVDTPAQAEELIARLLHPGRIHHLVCGNAVPSDPRLQKFMVGAPSAEVATQMLAGATRSEPDAEMSALAEDRLGGVVQALSIAAHALKAGMPSATYGQRLDRYLRDEPDDSGVGAVRAVAADLLDRLKGDDRVVAGLIAALPPGEIALSTPAVADLVRREGASLPERLREPLSSPDRLEAALAECRSSGLIRQPERTTGGIGTPADRADPWVCDVLRTLLGDEEIDAALTCAARIAVAECQVVAKETEVNFTALRGLALRAETLAAFPPRQDERTARAVAVALRQICQALHAAGDPPLQNRLQQSLASLSEASFGAVSAEYAAILVDLAESYDSLGEVGRAEACYRQALDIQHSLTRNDAVSRAQFHRHAGFFYWRHKRFEPAEMELQETLRLLRAKFGERGAEVGGAFGDLGALYSDWNKSVQQGGPGYKAIAYNRKSLQLVLAAHGPCHLEVARRYHNLAQDDFTSGDVEDAVEHQLRAATIPRALAAAGNMPADHPDLAALAAPLPRYLDAAGRAGDIPRLPELVAEKMAEIQREAASWRTDRRAAS